MMHPDRTEEPPLGYVNPSGQVTKCGDEDRYACELCGCARWEHDCPIAYRTQKGRHEPQSWEGRPVCQRCADGRGKRGRMHPLIENMLRSILFGGE